MGEVAEYFIRNKCNRQILETIYGLHMPFTRKGVQEI